MNTNIRRFIVRLLVGLLTFAAGVAVAMLLGGFRPFQVQSHGCPGSRYRHTEPTYFHSVTPEPAYQYPVYKEHGYKYKLKLRELDALPPPPPPAEAPLPPSAR